MTKEQQLQMLAEGLGLMVLNRAQRYLYCRYPDNYHAAAIIAVAQAATMYTGTAIVTGLPSEAQHRDVMLDLLRHYTDDIRVLEAGIEFATTITNGGTDPCH